MIFQIEAKNGHGEKVNFSLHVEHQQDRPGQDHRYTASIGESSEPLEIGAMPSGYYSTGEAVSKVKGEGQSFSFGRGELKRQATHPFVVFRTGDPKTKKNRFFFQLPADEIKKAGKYKMSATVWARVGMTISLEIEEVNEKSIKKALQKKLKELNEILPDAFCITGNTYIPEDEPIAVEAMQYGIESTIEIDI